ncbi:MAG: hypothetical protein A2776_00850 [Candidatus Levybacteria bacterium RIFCSPHIGHO2_01_FULL_40_10]|nr:MAG: hypothetical protein A2776_00850 [Candidatus Levybacteria bacterium RIFCSPHIGHO2_01_FULL_40_10]
MFFVAFSFLEAYIATRGKTDQEQRLSTTLAILFALLALWLLLVALGTMVMDELHEISAAIDTAQRP